MPHRITQILDYHQMYGPEVDEALGVEEPAVDMWEAGELVPTHAQIMRLALLTDTAPEFFYTPVTEPDLGPMWICDRSKRKNGCQVITPEPIVRAPLGAS